MSNSRVIVSLDFPDGKQALDLCQKLDPASCKLKIGKELFTREGPALVEKLIASDFDVFLDLKYHDIPNTVASACHAAADLGVWMLNVHASGGRTMMEAACEALDKTSHKPLLIAVTILTSMSQEDLVELGITNSVEEQVIMLANLAKASGLNGVVCSAKEASRLRTELGEEFCLVTPGIRPANTNSDDQKRIMTPAEAINAGSHYLVIGRPITKADDPLSALDAINASIN
ncbi:MAG TPA: orotidine-5'-phosphate decarboxylase [Thiotrichaceae bacterium]|nr:orotidine-5'-phosphate decarboxylase [Thiotrichaceae bacterium]HIM09173.1 orotidine-5'-phosphate decarboxylase [Gammaproteobacteria bacterium]